MACYTVIQWTRGLHTMKKKLWNKDFILLLQGNAVSTIGDMMYGIAIGYWVFEKTGSTGLMGIMSSISMFISLFLSPFSGSIVDKCNRKWLMAGIDIVQGIIMLGVGIMAYMDTLNVPVVLIAAVLAAFGGVFYWPAVSTLRLDIIPRDDMVRGQSVFSGVQSVINMTGNAFSGVMVAFFGVPLIVIINGLSNLYSAFTVMFVSVPRTVQQGNPITVKGLMSDTWTAVKTIVSDKYLKLFVPCTLLINLLVAGPLSLMLPFCLEKGLSVEMYGYLTSVFTAASLACVMIMSVVKMKPKVRYLVLTVGFFVSIVFLVMTYISVRFIPMCIYMFIASFGMCAGNTVLSAALMLALPEENRGAISGFMNSGPVAGSALSTVIYGLMGDVFPLYIVFAVGSALSLIPMVYTLFHPRVREFIHNN